MREWIDIHQTFTYVSPLRLNSKSEIVSESSVVPNVPQQAIGPDRSGVPGNRDSEPAGTTPRPRDPEAERNYSWHHSFHHVHVHNLIHFGDRPLLKEQPQFLSARLIKAQTCTWVVLRGWALNIVHPWQSRDVHIEGQRTRVWRGAGNVESFPYIVWATCSFILICCETNLADTYTQHAIGNCTILQLLNLIFFHQT